MPGPTFGTIANFTMADRKRNLVAFGLFGPNDNISFIFDAGFLLQTGTLTGTLDGVNAVFTIPFQFSGTVNIYRNGVLQNPNTMYSIIVNTVTFLDPYVPKPGDYLQVQAPGPAASAGATLKLLPLVGTNDGVNATFTVSGFFTNILAVYQNGLLQQAGVDYVIFANAVTFQPGSIPPPNSILQAMIA